MNTKDISHFKQLCYSYHQSKDEIDALRQVVKNACLEKRECEQEFSLLKEKVNETQEVEGFFKRIKEETNEETYHWMKQVLIEQESLQHVCLETGIPEIILDLKIDVCILRDVMTKEGYHYA